MNGNQMPRLNLFKIHTVRWTPEMDDLLRAGVRQGWPSQRIAASINAKLGCNVSRDSCNSRYARLKRNEQD